MNESAHSWVAAEQKWSFDPSCQAHSEFVVLSAKVSELTQLLEHVLRPILESAFLSRLIDKSNRGLKTGREDPLQFVSFYGVSQPVGRIGVLALLVTKQSAT